MDPANDETNNVHMNDAHENVVRHENGDPGSTANEMLEDPGPLLPSKTAGGPDLGVPGTKPGTIYREKQIKVLRTFSPAFLLLLGVVLSCFLMSELGLMSFLWLNALSCVAL